MCGSSALISLLLLGVMLYCHDSPDNMQLRRTMQTLNPVSQQGPTMVAAMSAAERDEHEDRALKMRKAMGENLGDDVAGEEHERTRAPPQPHPVRACLKPYLVFCDTG